MRPEITLKSVVLPAPLGPMTPTSEPAATSSSTSFRIVAPPICRPMPSICSGSRGSARLVRRGRDGGGHPVMSSGYFDASARCDLVGRGRVDELGHECAAVGDELGLVHLLDQGVVALADRHRALGAIELEAFERRDHRVDVALALLDGVHDHDRRVEAVGAEQVGRAAFAVDQIDHLGVRRRSRSRPGSSGSGS